MSSLKSATQSSFFNFEELQDSVSQIFGQTYITQFNAGYMGLGGVRAGSAMSNSFTTELQGHQCFKGWIEVFSLSGQRRPWYSSFQTFWWKSSFYQCSPPFSYLLLLQLLPKHHLQNSEFCSFSYFPPKLFRRLHTGLTSFKQAPWLPRLQKTIFI